MSFGLGTAVVGHNRRATYFTEKPSRSAGSIVNGFTQMYGDTSDPNFSHIEGYEDHYVNLLYTWNEKQSLSGVVVNLACPSQETEYGIRIKAQRPAVQTFLVQLTASEGWNGSHSHFVTTQVPARGGRAPEGIGPSNSNG